MKLKIKLPRGDAVADFPSQFSQRGKKKSTEAFLNSVVNGVISAIASLEPGFADLDLRAGLKPGFADLNLNTDLNFNYETFKPKMLKTTSMDPNLHLGTDLDFSRGPRLRRSRRR